MPGPGLAATYERADKMHELGLARPMIETVIESAELAGAKQVKRVYISIGLARDVVPELMDMTFKRLTKDTIAEGAELIVNQVPVSERCEDCGMVFPINLRDEATWHCPRCGSRHYKLHSGREFAVDRIEVIKEDAAETKVA